MKALHNTPPPLAKLATLATPVAAMTLFLLLAGPAQAQTPPPPQCTSSICTVSLASVSQVVDGCGDHATPGRMKMTLSSTNPSVTRGSFNINLGFITSRNDFSSTFSDWEWRTAAIGGNRWRNPDGTRNINFSGGVLGDNIIEVRPKAGAHIWSNRNPANPNQGPGELVVPVFSPPENRSQWTRSGSAYFLFMGGKGCARVNEGGEKVGGNQ